MSGLPAKRILVADDEPQVAGTLKMLLGLRGHTVELVANAAEALAAYEPGKFDLVISDFSLGDKNGLELARIIKELSPKQPFILITAYAESMAENKERLANIDYLLGKPFALEEFDAALAAAFRSA